MDLMAPMNDSAPTPSDAGTQTERKEFDSLLDDLAQYGDPGFFPADKWKRLQDLHRQGFRNDRPRSVAQDAEDHSMTDALYRAISESTNTSGSSIDMRGVVDRMKRQGWSIVRSGRANV